MSNEIEFLYKELADHELRKPVKPKSRRIMMQNATERAIMNAMEGNGQSIALMSDEGDVLLKGGVMNQIGLRNKGWDGPRVLPIDRADGAIIACNPRVTMSILVQPEIFNEYLEKRGRTTRASGHWSRYLPGWPTSTQGSRFEWLTMDDPGWNYLPIFHGRVTALLEEYGRQIKSGKVERIVVEFANEARPRWIEMANSMESMLKPWGELNDIKDFASKAMEIVGRVAAILHWFSNQEGKITVDALNRAGQIVEWHVWEFKRIFSPTGRVPQEQIDAQSLEDYLVRQYGGRTFVGAPRNEVLRNGPVRPEGRFSAALDVLKQLGRVHIRNGEKRRCYIFPGTPPEQWQ